MVSGDLAKQFAQLAGVVPFEKDEDTNESKSTRIPSHRQRYSVLPLPKSTSAIDAEGEADTKSSSNLNVEHTN